MSSVQNIEVMTHQSCDFLIWIFNKFAFKWKFSKKATTLKVSFNSQFSMMILRAIKSAKTKVQVNFSFDRFLLHDFAFCAWLSALKGISLKPKNIIFHIKFLLNIKVNFRNDAPMTKKMEVLNWSAFKILLHEMVKWRISSAVL